MKEPQPNNQNGPSVSFNTDVFVSHTSVLKLDVRENITQINLGRSESRAILDVTDESFLILAETVFNAIDAMLTTSTTAPDKPYRPVAQSESDDGEYRAIRVDAWVTISGQCPMSFELCKEGATIVVLNEETLILHFDDWSLFKLARLLGQARHKIAARMDSGPPD